MRIHTVLRVNLSSPIQGESQVITLNMSLILPPAACSQPILRHTALFQDWLEIETFESGADYSEVVAHTRSPDNSVYCPGAFDHLVTNATGAMVGA